MQPFGIGSRSAAPINIAIARGLSWRVCPYICAGSHPCSRLQHPSHCMYGAGKTFIGFLLRSD